MSAVDPQFAQWLMAEALYQVSADTTVNTRWGASAQTSERVTTIATKADATAEAARQLAFLGGSGPLVVDEHQLRGAWAAKLGQVITLTIDRLGYESGADVFVIGAQDDRSADTSTVTVIKRL